jgi:5-methylcytosine-specific restriction endonuclease McrBC GTP-binding regulatory subunit McrB
MLANYLLALQTKRFTLLCGISGTGKTRLAREVARFFNEAGGRTEVVAVRPDWTDHRGLLGYHNPITQSYHATPCLRLLLDAAAEVETARRVGRTPRPFFLILDEMNLARVEQYFSDFLSCLESGEALHLHHQPELERGPGAIPCVLPIPENLFITGTVNVDETTFMFSPKVLDRAFALEFNEVDLAGLVADGVPAEAAGASLALGELPGELCPPTPVTAEAARWLAAEHPSLWETITTLHALLAVHHRHFGYRVVNEVARFVQLASEQTAGEAETLWAVLDLALLQKVLPKFHGMQSELEPVLVQLEVFDARLPRFQAKVQRMLSRVRATGFTAYME